MKNIKLTYRYDGTNFVGFQRQNKGRTVQGELEKALKYFLKEDITLTSSGRTDKGVHALMQVSNFKSETPIPAKSLKYMLNGRLPEDIYILESEEADLEFHSRHSAVRRSYIYVIKHKKDYNIYDRNYVTYVDYDVNVEKLQEILNPLIGIHDFESFRTTDCGADHATREIEEIRVYKEGEKIVVYLKANAFVKSMVRIIMGSALAICKGIRDENYIKRRIEKPNPLDDKLTASPRGLYLNEVIYREKV